LSETPSTSRIKTRKEAAMPRMTPKNMKMGSVPSRESTQDPPRYPTYVATALVIPNDMAVLTYFQALPIGLSHFFRVWLV